MRVLALTGAHLGHPAEMQGCAADELDVEVPLAEHPPASLAHHREGLDQQIVGVLSPLQDECAEVAAAGPQRIVVETLASRARAR